jgi:serine/threonine-protein kinase
MHHKVIGDKYKIIDSIGKGGMGSVFLCENLFLKNNWAVKKVEIHKENFDDGEIEALKKLHHENIPQIVDYYIMDNSLYIVQSYIRGYSMPEYVNGYSLSEDLIKKWMIQLGSVIDYLHSIKPSPILHLDIKPGNIIVTPNENIVLVDFGSSIINRKHWNNSKTYSMTYSAPEQILGKPVGSFSDIFSYGKVFDKLLDTAITEGCISENFYRKYKDIIKTTLPLNPELREKNIKKVLNKIKEL